MDRHLLKDCIQDYIELAEEAHAQSEYSDFEAGRNLAYYEILSKLQTMLKIHYPDEVADYGLNFNLDKKFLSRFTTKVPF